MKQNPHTLVPPRSYPRPLPQLSKMRKHDHGVLVRRLSQPRAEGIRRHCNCGGLSLAWPWRASVDGCWRAGEAYRCGRTRAAARGRRRRERAAKPPPSAHLRRERRGLALADVSGRAREEGETCRCGWAEGGWRERWGRAEKSSLCWGLVR